MAMNSAPIPSAFAIQLKYCREKQGLNHVTLATEMIRLGFSPTIPGGQLDANALAAHLNSIELANLQFMTDFWPFPQDTRNFIALAAASMPAVFKARKRLFMAMALDTLNGSDP